MSQSTNDDLIKKWIKEKYDSILIKKVGEAYRVNLYVKSDGLVQTSHLTNSHFLKIVDNVVEDHTCKKKMS